MAANDVQSPLVSDEEEGVVFANELQERCCKGMEAIVETIEALTPRSEPSDAPLSGRSRQNSDAGCSISRRNSDVGISRSRQNSDVGISRRNSRKRFLTDCDDEEAEESEGPIEAIVTLWNSQSHFTTAAVRDHKFQRDRESLTLHGRTIVPCPTIGVDLGMIHLTQHIVMRVWDCGGMERFHSIISSYLKSTAAVILVYSAKDRKSFDNIAKIWWPMVLEERKKEMRGMSARSKLLAPFPPLVVLVAAQCEPDDDEHERRVSAKEGEKLAESLVAYDDDGIEVGRGKARFVRIMQDKHDPESQSFREVFDHVTDLVIKNGVFPMRKYVHHPDGVYVESGLNPERSGGILMADDLDIHVGGVSIENTHGSRRRSMDVTTEFTFDFRQRLTSDDNDGKPPKRGLCALLHNCAIL